MNRILWNGNVFIVTKSAAPEIISFRQTLAQSVANTRNKYKSLRWRHNGCDNVSNHQPHDCLLNGLFRCRSKQTSKLRATGLCAGVRRGPVNSLHKWPVTRKMFPFDDVIMFSVFRMPCLSSMCLYSGNTCVFIDNDIHESNFTTK